MPLMFLIAFQAAVAQPADRRLTVRELMENAERYDGRIVTVSGWVETCERLSCSLFQSRREALQRRSPLYHLSIGSSPWFDAFARRSAPTRVTLRARFSARCVTDPRDDVIAICADRVRSLDPIGIVRTTRPGSAARGH